MTFEEKGEPKQNWTEVCLLASLIAPWTCVRDRQPAHNFYCNYYLILQTVQFWHVLLVASSCSVLKILNVLCFLFQSNQDLWTASDPFTRDHHGCLLMWPLHSILTWLTLTLLPTRTMHLLLNTLWISYHQRSKVCFTMRANSSMGCIILFATWRTMRQLWIKHWCQLFLAPLG